MFRLQSRSLLLVLLLISSGSALAEMVLVGGATGRQGNAAIDELISRGYEVRCLTRKQDSKKAQRIAERCTELVQGNYADPESLDAAMDDIKKVFFYSGFSRDEVTEGQNVIDAAKKAGIEHLIYSSGAAAEPGKGIEGSPKMQVEIALVDSGVPYTVLRPVAFMENFDRQQKRTLANGISESRGPERVLAFISIKDIGFFVGEAFDDPDSWLGRAENIAGDKLTVQEYVDTFSKVMGAEIAYNRMPLEEYLETFPKPLRPLFRWYDEVGYDADVAGLREQYPDLVSLEEYLMATGWKGYGR